ncbi:MAG: hypothetical protein C4293_08230 [Nitrospiraceae bacterium]
MTFITPDFLPYLLAILGLLLVWQFHAMQVSAGRIQAVDFWNRSGFRMFLYATPKDGSTCPACVKDNGRVILPIVAAKKKFSALHATCTNPAGCRCLLVGLHGGWPEARRVLERLKTTSQSVGVRLSDEEMVTLLDGYRDENIGASIDRIPVHILEAMRVEESDPELAIFRYRFVIENAKANHELPLVVPSYLRMADLLERIRRTKEALDIISQFERVCSETKMRRYSPSAVQSGAMSLRKTRLMLALKGSPKSIASPSASSV